MALAGQIGMVAPLMLHTIENAALLHDVGKLAIADSLLNKPGPLTPDEYAQVKQHSVLGADILSGVDFPGALSLLVRHHHENWDGSGYPDGLRRDDIPVGARVLAIADCYDALTSDRPYRRALSHATAISMIEERRGSMFDPQMTDSFVQMLRILRSAAVAARLVPLPSQARGPWPVEMSAR